MGVLIKGKNKKAIIAIVEGFSVEYLGKGTYIFQGEKYKVLTYRDKAQVYTSAKKAEAVIERIRKSGCVNLPYSRSHYKIIEIAEEVEE